MLNYHKKGHLFFSIGAKQRQATVTGTWQSINRCWVLCTTAPETFSPLVVLLKSYIYSFRSGFFFAPYLEYSCEVTFCEKHPALLPTKKGCLESECRSLQLANFALYYLPITQRKCCLFRTHFKTLFTVSKRTSGLMSQATVTSLVVQCWLWADTEWHRLQASDKDLL